jgi:hypothetical protein
MLRLAIPGALREECAEAPARTDERREEHCLRHTTSPMTVFVLVATIYFVMSYPLSRCMRYMEMRMSPGR